MVVKEPINSNLYWDRRFTDDWEHCNGPEQSRFFARIAIEHLPKWLIEQLRREALTLADWGCAQGDGADVWASYIDPQQIVGIDFSTNAIEQASQRYPAIRFINEDWLLSDAEQGESFDVVFSSNTLEHFHKPYEVLHSIANHAKKAIALILPYKEFERIDEHFFSFLAENIPLVLKNGFRLVWSQVVDCRLLPNTLWGGDQIILVYADPKWVDALGLVLKDECIAQVDTESQIAILHQAAIEQGEQIAKRDEQIANLNHAIAKRDEQIAEFNQAIAERDETIFDLNQAIAERDGQIASLNQVVNGHAAAIMAIKDQLAASNHRIDELVSSTSWRLTAPLRAIVRAVRARFTGGSNPLGTITPATSNLARWQQRGNYLIERYRQGVHRHGLLRSIPLAARALCILGLAWLKKLIWHRQYEQRLQSLAAMIITHRGFIDLFHVPMGWHTPLFQRFQHMSLQAVRLGGLALYGGHRQVDKDMFVFQRVQGNVVVFDALDERVVQCVFDTLRKTSQKKILRLQSIDLATRLEQVERFITDGITVIYEYIDEINEEITGPIPDFVKQRHAAILRDERILVVATADKLFNEVKQQRTANCLLSTNGVDLDHWRKAQKKPPADMEAAVQSGRAIVGYHGALAKWIDYELLRKIADSDNYELVLIGYEHDTSLTESGLIRHPHVHFLGSKPYFVLNEYVAFYDVGILPFKRYALTESVSPVKLFEYMAAGKPVVTTNLQECAKYKSCLVSESHETFLEQLSTAVAGKNDETYMALLAADAQRNSWSEKATVIYQLAGVQLADNALVTPGETDVLPAVNHEGSTGRKLYQFLRRIYWKLPLADSAKEAIVGRARIFSRISERMLAPNNQSPQHREDLLNAYVAQVLSIPDKRGPEYVELAKDSYIRQSGDPKVLAYYLPQYHPTPENDAWWGRGTTEWNNVSRAMPQYVGHYQPRRPGELGYYDLRIKDTMKRQIELAQMHGVHGFVFYYYWFDNRRVLDKPLDMFLENLEFDFPFCLCWANESWTRRFDGTCGEILLKQSESVESYTAFIDSVIPYMRDQRYIRVGNRPVLIIYRPSFVPECAATLEAWRKHCRNAGVGEPYIIGVKEHTWDADLLTLGFDAQSEFHPGTLFKHCENITNKIQYVRRDFGGLVFDYRDIVQNQKYFRYSYPKLYRAVMPMWDNTARRNNAGMIFEGATPELYKRWLKDVLVETKMKGDLDEPFVFINAWNEWGEGTYLEPDARYGYAFLQATKEAIEESR